MQSEKIVTVLLSAASFLKKPVQDIAVQTVKDGYEGLRDYVKRKLAGNREASAALDRAIEKPDSEGRKAVLLEESAPEALSDDEELERLARKLASLLKKAGGEVSQKIIVKGNRNKVQVAARDIINTQKHIQKNEITPDERHINAAQRENLKDVIAEVANRLAGESGKPDYAKVHVMLQRRFDVASYNLILREDYEEALSFLKQQRAINRSKLRRRNPKAYQEDFFTVIWASANALGWERPAVYAFAQEKLELRKPITSLKQLGVNQLKEFAEYMRRESKKSA